MANPTPSLSAATATGPGASTLLTNPAEHNTMQVTTTGSPSLVIVDLEGSQDGTNWFRLARYDSRFTGPLVTSDLYVVTNVRANLLQLSGGTTPTVTASIASV